MVVLLAAFTGLRFGELAGLACRRVNLLHGTLTVERQLQESYNSVLTFSPPKTAAGNRTVAIPRNLLPELQARLHEHAGAPPAGLVFPAPDGGGLRRRNFRSRFWLPACKTVGISGFRFHDLRHTGNTLAASTGASTKELMTRMGHASPRAALIYQHATAERDAWIADRLAAMADEAIPPPAIGHLPR